MTLNAGMSVGRRSGSQKLPPEFGKYSILGHLATGGMAEVYVARQVGLEGFEKIVVIKRVRPELNTDLDTTTSFLDEARLVATLEHPNIAQVYEIGRVNDSYFFVMEYVHGADLRQLMEAAVAKRVKISLADAVYIIIGVCAGLHYAHDKRSLDGQPLSIIHRDVSPSNVLISHDGAVKVCDFGIAKAENRNAHLTRGVLKGKFAYMSPEQCRSQSLDRRSDVFAIGILLYELSTLSRLFDSNSDFDLLRSVIEQPAPLPSSRMPGYPAELERIVLRALEKNPDHRYPTAQAMQLDLEAFARESKLAMSSVSAAQLMNALFEKRIDMWARARGHGNELADYVLEIGGDSTNELPAVLPVGTDTSSNATDAIEHFDTSRHSRPAGSIKIPIATEAITASVPAPRRARPSRWWLACAALATIVAGGATFAKRNIVTTPDRTVFEAEARRLGTALDDTAKNLQLRLEGAVAAPLLRAAIETDAATIADLAASEKILAPNSGEVIELFQTRGGKTGSLLRRPTNAPPLAIAPGRATRFRSDGRQLIAVANAPITGYKAGFDGVFAVAVPIDLATARADVAEHATSAALAGLGPELALMPNPAPGGDRIEIAIPGDRGRLVVTPRVASNAWMDQVRYSSAGLAGVLLLIYLIGLVRPRR
jgi:serine/threonine protein kinase